jgi:hypothetical protein
VAEASHLIAAREQREEKEKCTRYISPGHALVPYFSN